MVRSVSALVVLGVAFFAGTPARARTVILHAVRDNTLYVSGSGQLSNGAGRDMFVGLTGRFGMRRALVAFDLTDSIPANVFVDSVQLVLRLNKTVTPPSAIGLHRVQRAWGEGTSIGSGGGGLATAGDATWLHTSFPSSFWDTPGGDFLPQPSATHTVDNVGFHTWESGGELVADVQYWLQHPDANFGWLLLGNESTASAKRFDTHEATDPAVRPQLVVHFTPTPVTPIAWGGIKSLYR